MISFKDRTETSDPLYANHKILKLQNIITLSNSLFSYDQPYRIITYQMLSQIIFNFLKISTGKTQGFPVISP